MKGITFPYLEKKYISMIKILWGWVIKSHFFSSQGSLPMRWHISFLEHDKDSYLHVAKETFWDLKAHQTDKKWQLG